MAHRSHKMTARLATIAIAKQWFILSYLHHWGHALLDPSDDQPTAEPSVDQPQVDPSEPVIDPSDEPSVDQTHLIMKHLKITHLSGTWPMMNRLIFMPKMIQLMMNHPID